MWHEDGTIKIWKEIWIFTKETLGEAGKNLKVWLTWFCVQLQIAASYSAHPRLEGYCEVGVGMHNWLQLSVLYTLHIMYIYIWYRWICNFTYLILIRASMKSLLTSPHDEYIWSTQIGHCYFFLFLNSRCKCADREVLSISSMGFLSGCWVFSHSCLDCHHGCPITPLAGLASFLSSYWQIRWISTVCASPVSLSSRVYLPSLPPLLTPSLQALKEKLWR